VICRRYFQRKVIPEVGTGKWKSPFADCGEAEESTSSWSLVEDLRLRQDGMTRVKHDDMHLGELS